jgi:photosynthetic reaction center H subunit
MPLRSINLLESYEFRPGSFDIRGWHTRTMADEEDVGRVHDILIDEDDQPRYLDVDLGMFRKHVLLPVGHAVIDEQDDVVWVTGMSKDQFGEIPEYRHEHDEVAREYEERVHRSYGSALAGRAYYHRPEYGGADRGEPNDSPAAQRMAPLRQLDEFDVAEGDADPRGWAVVAADGRRIGEVDDLVVDTAALRARYLDVELDRGRAGDTGGRRALVPVGYARLDDSGRRVLLDAVTSGEASTLPTYDESFGRDYEDRVGRHFESRYDDERRYHHPRFRADRLFARRREHARHPADPQDRDRTRACDVRISR